jgi:hypothetical protein
LLLVVAEVVQVALKLVVAVVQEVIVLLVMALLLYKEQLFL